MPAIKRPRKGSLQYWPRKRAKRIYPRMKFPASHELRPLGFAGFKAGMTHVSIMDTNPKSHSYGKTITTPAAILDCPPLFVCGLRFYSDDKCIGEKWITLKELEIERKTNPAKKKTEIPKEKIKDVRLIVATQPKKSGMRKKKPDVFEIEIGGGSRETPLASGGFDKKLEYAEKLLGKEISARDVFHVGEFIDVSAVTKGHGFTGPVKRFGIKIQRRKDQQMHRHAGTKGPTIPRKIDWRVPMPGQYGFFTRTEFNKRILMIDSDAKKINPKGGFLRYGMVPSNFILIEGSIPGATKRLVRLRKAMRPRKRELPIEIKYISLESKQGV